MVANTSDIVRLTAALTESGRKIFHSKNTRKPDFACIALLSTDYLAERSGLISDGNPYWLWPI